MTKRWRETEFTAADFLVENGWPEAEAVGSSLPGSDITGTPAVTWEIKARRDFNPQKTLRQAEGHGGDFQIAVMRPDGAGPKTVHKWPAFTTFEQMVKLLRLAGYGEPLADDIERVGDFEFLLECLEEAKELVASKMAARI